MGLFDWLSGSKKAPPAPPSSGLSRNDPTQPFGRTQHPPSGVVGKILPPAQMAGESAADQKKNARYMRRELLYGVVRESMIRAGVLSQGYKFKALALDPRGLQFIVMVDLAPEFGSGNDRWGEIEALIAQSAKARHGVVVKAVYWRLSDQVSLGKPVADAGALATAPSVAATSVNLSPTEVAPHIAPLAPPTAAAAPPASAPASMAQAASAGLAAAAGSAAFLATQALPRPTAAAIAPTMPMSRREGPISKPMPLFPEGPETEDAVDFDVSSASAGRARPMAPGSGRFEAIADDEVEAFKRALAAGANAPAAVAAATAATAAKKPAAPTPAGSYTLLTGFEDTEAVDPDFQPPALGSTQYGELR